ncbi:MAG: hypothetical protein JNK78_18035 [Planctomycetes bacterium]|nr:hypothetical protein [Planctomycetota bacterium]
MASSRAEALRTTASATFALQEVIACWNQGYEALAQGDIERVTALLEIAEDHLANAGAGEADTPEQANLRDQARAARGRLEHGVKAGLDAIRAELGQTRRGAKALRGYGDASRRLGGNVEKSV